MSVQPNPPRKADYSPPPVNADFYRIADLLDEKERAVAKRVREFMEREVAPIIEEYWGRDEFPFEIIPKLPADKNDFAEARLSLLRSNNLPAGPTKG